LVTPNVTGDVADLPSLSRLKACVRSARFVRTAPRRDRDGDSFSEHGGDGRVAMRLEIQPFGAYMLRLDFGPGAWGLVPLRGRDVEPL
jgi:hypothetical protein